MDMVFDKPKKSVSERHDEFEKEIIQRLSEEPMDKEDIIDVALEKYESERHARVLGPRQMRKLQKDDYISEDGNTYVLNLRGKKAFNLFDEEIKDKDSKITQYLLNGGKDRTGDL